MKGEEVKNSFFLFFGTNTSKSYPHSIEISKACRTWFMEDGRRGTFYLACFYSIGHCESKELRQGLHLKKKHEKL